MPEHIYAVERWEGECTSGCGAKVYGRKPGLPGVDLTFCRRCQAHTLYRWTLDGVAVDLSVPAATATNRNLTDEYLERFRAETDRIYRDLLSRHGWFGL